MWRAAVEMALDSVPCAQNSYTAWSRFVAYSLLTRMSHVEGVCSRSITMAEPQACHRDNGKILQRIPLTAGVSFPNQNHVDEVQREHHEREGSDLLDNKSHERTVRQVHAAPLG